MARYLVERTFPDGLGLPPTPQGNEVARTVVGNNAENGVTWIHSYVTTDKKQTFCIKARQGEESRRKCGAVCDRKSLFRPKHQSR